MPNRVVYVVRARIPIKDEKEWNRWHNEEHIPRVLAQPGFIQVHKYRSISTNKDEAEYHVLYELQNQTAYHNYVESEEGRNLRQEYLDAYGPRTKITRWAWLETFHLMK